MGGALPALPWMSIALCLLLPAGMLLRSTGIAVRTQIKALTLLSAAIVAQSFNVQGVVAVLTLLALLPVGLWLRRNERPQQAWTYLMYLFFRWTLVFSLLFVAAVLLFRQLIRGSWIKAAYFSDLSKGLGFGSDSYGAFSISIFRHLAMLSPLALIVLSSLICLVFIGLSRQLEIADRRPLGYFVARSKYFSIVWAAGALVGLLLSTMGALLSPVWSEYFVCLEVFFLFVLLSMLLLFVIYETKLHKLTVWLCASWAILLIFAVYPEVRSRLSVVVPTQNILLQIFAVLSAGLLVLLLARRFVLTQSEAQQKFWDVSLIFGLVICDLLVFRLSIWGGRSLWERYDQKFIFQLLNDLKIFIDKINM